MNIPLILFWPFYIGSHNAIFSQFASKHKTSVTFFSSSFSDSWMLPKLVAFYSLHRICTRSRQNLPCYADRMVGMHNAYLPTPQNLHKISSKPAMLCRQDGRHAQCRELGVGTMFLFLNPLTYLCSGRQGCARLIFSGWLDSDSYDSPGDSTQTQLKSQIPNLLTWLNSDSTHLSQSWVKSDSRLITFFYLIWENVVDRGGGGGCGRM